MTSTRPLVDLTATCACGAVAVSVRGPVIAMLLCACEDCQKATGSGHASVATVRKESFALSGETRAFSLTADSGATTTRHFCPTCGTPLYAVSSRFKGAVLLPVGLFGRDTDWFAPTQMIFARSHRGWDSVPDGMPRHDTYRPREQA
jgi:hypothetical protein